MNESSLKFRIQLSIPGTMNLQSNDDDLGMFYHPMMTHLCISTATLAYKASKARPGCHKVR